MRNPSADSQSWNKLLNKSGRLFHSVVAQVKQTEAVRLAAIYAPLQAEIVRQKKMDLKQRSRF